MLEERDIRAFVYGTTRYFEVAAQQAATVGSPYLVTQGLPEIHDYTGMIAISGRRNGVVYFSAPRGMLTVMLMKMNESNVSHENLCDLVGEVANTISGNVRREFGKDFAISAPTVVTGTTGPIELPAGCRPVVIPINWRSHAAKLVVCLQ
jgi:chemotaxis protein CheX